MLAYETVNHVDRQRAVHFSTLRISASSSENQIIFAIEKNDT